jgi:hypothetical protein
MGIGRNDFHAPKGKKFRTDFLSLFQFSSSCWNSNQMVIFRTTFLVFLDDNTFALSAEEGDKISLFKPSAMLITSNNVGRPVRRYEYDFCFNSDFIHVIFLVKSLNFCKRRTNQKHTHRVKKFSLLTA